LLGLIYIFIIKRTEPFNTYDVIILVNLCSTRKLILFRRNSFAPIFLLETRVYYYLEECIQITAKI